MSCFLICILTERLTHFISVLAQHFFSLLTLNFLPTFHVPPVLLPQANFQMKSTCKVQEFKDKMKSKCPAKMQIKRISRSVKMQIKKQLKCTYLEKIYDDIFAIAQCAINVQLHNVQCAMCNCTMCNVQL